MRIACPLTAFALKGLHLRGKAGTLHPDRDMLSANLTEHPQEYLIPTGLSVLCFLYYMFFLLKHGEMFYRGSDAVTNTAYAVTMFNKVYQGGWTVPKPVHMLLFGCVYWITRDLWFVNLVFVLSTVLTVFVGCWLILRYYRAAIGCIAFCAFMMTMPAVFLTTMAGGAGCINTLFLLLAVVCVERTGGTAYRILAIVFLCLANLTRPDSWPSSYLIILLIVAPKLIRWNGSRLHKSDLLFLIPLAMPLIWMLIDWAVFADPLYSMKTAQTFAIEVAEGKSVGQGLEVDGFAAYPTLIKRAFFDTFTLSSWFSLRTALLIVLGLAGVVVMLHKRPRLLILLACPLLGSTLFYLITSLREMVFRFGYLYYNWVLVAVTISVGFSSLFSLTRRIRCPYVNRFIPVGLACLVLWFLSARPYEERVMHCTIPKLKNWAAISKRTAPAIESIADDVKETGGNPVVITANPVPGSRIALKLLTGENIFLADRLARREKQGHEVHVPNLEGRTVYFAAPEKAQTVVNSFLRRLVSKSKEKEAIYRKEGLLVVKCIY